jgi:cell division protein FtsB
MSRLGAAEQRMHLLHAENLTLKTQIEKLSDTIRA